MGVQSYVERFLQEGEVGHEHESSIEECVATKVTEDLCGVCPNVQVTIGDVEIDQQFFVQDLASHFVILGKPYKRSSQLETKII